MNYQVQNPRIKICGDFLRTNLFGSTPCVYPEGAECIRFVKGHEPEGAMFASLLLEKISDGHQGYQIDDSSITKQRCYEMNALYNKLTIKDAGSKDAKLWIKISDLGMEQLECDNQNLLRESERADLFLIDDKNLCFRKNVKGRELISDGSWAIINTKYPILQGEFWDGFEESQKLKTVVILDIEEVRKASIQISRRHSWERTALDLNWEITYNPSINALSSFAYVIIHLGLEGALFFDNTKPKNEHRATLFFNPEALEGEWTEKNGCALEKVGESLLAMLAYQVLQNPLQPDFSRGIQKGMRLAKEINQKGLVLQDQVLTYPYQQLVGMVQQDDDYLASVMVKAPKMYETSSDSVDASKAFEWVIINETQSGEDLLDISKRIVIEGVENALSNVPIGKFGAKLTFDRYEIEQLNSISQILSEYVKTKQKKPLNIGVFGSPGSGKSFGVEQIGKSIVKDAAFQTFNVAQFTSVKDLVSSFHQIRDVGLSGKIPFVFWDEFDSSFGEQKLGWLKYFLSPMQDGSFRDGDLVHPIGKSIFIFAGGTCSAFKEFSSIDDEELVKAVKLPDFISRLKGTIDIAGPNAEKSYGSDRFYVLRRAIILRSMLERNFPKLFSMQDGIMVANIDKGVLNAFLEIEEYNHGVRSMESILTMSSLVGAIRYKKSDLPAPSQLGIHVDANQFTGIMNRIELEGDNLERLAAAIHNRFCEFMTKEGYVWGEETSVEKKTHCLLVPYADLSEFDKQQNRLHACDMPVKLMQAGYIMLPAKSIKTEFVFSEDEIEFLAKLEHERWVRTKLLQGWNYGEKTDRDKRLHSAMVPWENLSDIDKEKDRILVKELPALLQEAGFMIQKK